MEAGINYPQKAFETYKRLRSHPRFSELHHFISKIFKRIDDPVERARKTHQYVESFTNEALDNPVAQKFLSCKKGCTACCHTQVSVNQDEIELLASRVISDEIDIDLHRLYLQSRAENDAKKWFEIPHIDRGCVFLNKNGECKVYNDRPSVCRTNNAFSDPRMCDTSDGVEKPVRLLNTEKADIAIIASYKASGKAGTLPYLLWNQLSKLKSKSFIKNIKKDLSKNSELE